MQLGNGGLWRWNNLPPRRKSERRRQRRQRPNSSNSAPESAGGAGFRLPFNQVFTGGSLVLAGDTIAQLTHRFKTSELANQTSTLPDSHYTSQDVMKILFSEHDWIRALRMGSYGFLLYGPGTYAWYQYLDRTFVEPTVKNLVLKVMLNQVVLGTSGMVIIFAWNNLWQGTLSQLPNKYLKDAFPTLIFGFRFWIPVSVLNFWIIPLQARVAFMSTCSMFWNFTVSTVLNK